MLATYMDKCQQAAGVDDFHLHIDVHKNIKLTATSKFLHLDWNANHLETLYSFFFLLLHPSTKPHTDLYMWLLCFPSGSALCRRRDWTGVEGVKQSAESKALLPDQSSPPRSGSPTYPPSA